MEGLSIAPASLRDLRPVLRLERVCFGVDSWPLLDVMSALVWPGGVRLKASISGRLVGLALAEPAWTDGISMIASVGVDPDFRRQGIGSALLSECEERLSGKVIRLTVRADNPPAIRLYERLGYTFFSRMQNYYRDGQAGLVMEKVRTAE
jgi:ribosomal-protein-alanine N-acetyltransferase